MDTEITEFLTAAGFDCASLRRVPPRLREDAIQEACLAVLEHRNPESAIKTFVSREIAATDRCRASTQLNREQVDEYFAKGGE